MISLSIVIVILIAAIFYILDKNKKREIFIRKDAIEQSKNVIRGQINEELAPLFPDFPYTLKDCKFLSAPIDYIVFNGMNESLEDIELIFVDVKTGKSRLTKREQLIQKAIKDGRVRFEVWRINNGQIKVI